MKHYLRILILSNDTGAVLHIRLTRPLQVLSQLTNGAIQFEVVHPGTIASVVDLSGYEIVVMQRYVPSEEMLGIWDAAKQLGKTLIFEIDDWLLGLPKVHPDAWVYRDLMAQRRIFSSLSTAHAVTVSTEMLKARLAPYHEHIYVVQNLIDTTIWKITRPRKRPDNAPIVIGFMGTPSHERDLQLVEDALVMISRRYGGRVAFHFYGCITTRLSTLPNTIFHKAEPLEEFARKFASRQIDIGLAPLLDTPFNHCKSNIKWLQYAACGAAGIFSDLPTYNRSIRHGETGLLAGSNPSEWCDALEELIENPNTRRWIARNAQLELRRNYTLEKGAGRLLETYKTILRLKSGSTPVQSKVPCKTYKARAGAAFRQQMILQRLSDGPKEQENTEVIQQAEETTSAFTVDVVVPMYRHADLAERCIDSVLRTTRPEHHLILVDDASPGNELSALFEKLKGHPRVTLMCNARNAGFLPTARRGAEAGKAPFILFLNSDIECITPDWIDRLIPRKEDVAVTGAKLLFPPQMSNGLGERVQHAGVARNADGDPYHIFMGWPPEAPEVDRDREVNCVTGACLLTRRSVWDQLGGFDPAFGRGVFEDVDYCWAVREAGYKILYVAGIVLYHWEHCGVPIHKHIQSTTLESSHHVYVAKWGRRPSDEYLFLGRREARGWDKARRLLRQADDRSKKDLVVEAIKIAPRLPDAQSGYARLCAALGRWKDARAAFLERTRLEPLNALAIHELTRFLMQRNSWKEASNWVERALLLEPHRCELYGTAAEIYLQLGCWDDLERVLRNYFTDSPWQAKSILDRLRLVPAARIFKSLDDALIERPAHPGLLNVKAHLQFCHGLFAPAVTTFREIKAATHQWADGIKAMIAERRYSEARRALDESMAEHPSKPDAVQLMALLEMESGQVKKGLQLLRDLLPQKCEDSVFLLEYLCLALEHKNEASALQILEHLLRLDLSRRQRREVLRIAKLHPDFLPIQLAARYLGRKVSGNFQSSRQVCASNPTNSNSNQTDLPFAYVPGDPMMNLDDSLMIGTAVLFGASGGGRSALSRLPAGIRVVAFADNDCTKHGKIFCGLKVFSPCDLLSLSYDYIIITSIHHQAISTQLRAMGIDSARIKLVSDFQFHEVNYAGSSGF